MSTSLLGSVYAGPLGKELFFDPPFVVMDRYVDPEVQKMRSIGEALGSLIVQSGYNQSIFLNGRRFDKELTRAAKSGDLEHYRWLIDNAFGAHGVTVSDVSPFVSTETGAEDSEGIVTPLPLPLPLPNSDMPQEVPTTEEAVPFEIRSLRLVS